MAVALVVALFFSSVFPQAFANCPVSYQELESALLNTDDNMEKLMLIFFPTNQPTSIVVNVNYIIEINASVIENETLEASPAIDDRQDVIKNHRVLREVEGYSYHYAMLQFRWTLSAINLFVEPNLLQILSLYTFQTDIHSVNLTLVLPNNCDIHSIKVNESTCNDKVDIIEGLNDLTSNVCRLSVVLKSLMRSITRDKTARIVPEHTTM